MGSESRELDGSDQSAGTASRWHLAPAGMPSEQGQSVRVVGIGIGSADGASDGDGERDADGAGGGAPTLPPSVAIPMFAANWRQVGTWC